MIKLKFTGDLLSSKRMNEIAQTRFKMETLRWANIFAGEEKYEEVKEFYGL